MHALVQAPILGFLEWYQWIMVVALIGLIIFYFQMKKRNM